MLQFENDKWVSPREYLFSMVLYYTLFSNGFYYKNFSSFVMITRMISPVWFALNGIGSIFNLISRLPQYASISKMINGTLFMNTFFLVLYHTFIFWFLSHVCPCVSIFLCSGSTVWLVLFLKFYIKLPSLFLEFYIKLPFSRQKLFSLCKLLAPNFVLLWKNFKLYFTFSI